MGSFSFSFLPKIESVTGGPKTMELGPRCPISKFSTVAPVPLLAMCSRVVGAGPGPCPTNPLDRKSATAQTGQNVVPGFIGWQNGPRSRPPRGTTPFQAKIRRKTQRREVPTNLFVITGSPPNAAGCNIAPNRTSLPPPDTNHNLAPGGKPNIIFQHPQRTPPFFWCRTQSRSIPESFFGDSRPI